MDLSDAGSILFNIGGLDELVVPNPQKQIELTGVYGINPSL